MILHANHLKESTMQISSTGNYIPFNSTDYQSNNQTHTQQLQSKASSNNQQENNGCNNNCPLEKRAHFQTGNNLNICC